MKYLIELQKKEILKIITGEDIKSDLRGTEVLIYKEENEHITMFDFITLEQLEKMIPFKEEEKGVLQYYRNKVNSFVTVQYFLEKFEYTSKDNRYNKSKRTHTSKDIVEKIKDFFNLD